MDFESQLKEFESHYSNLKDRDQIAEDLGPHTFVLKSKKRAHETKDIDLLFLALIHGNEVGGVAVLNHVLKSMTEGKFKPDIKMAFALGNVEAGFKNSRFVEKDLNRIFGTYETATHEDRRARELETLLKRSRYILDIHQTIEPTASPFFIFGFDKKSFVMAHTIAPSLPIISYSINERKENGLVATSYAIEQGGVAVTAELGQKGFDHTQLDLGYGLCRRAYWYVKNQRLHALKNFFLSIVLRKSKPHADDKILIFSYRHLNEGATNNLMPGFTNFMDIKKGQKLGVSSKGDILSPLDGKILFPKYGQAKQESKELFVILEQLNVQNFLKRFNLTL